MLAYISKIKDGNITRLNMHNKSLRSIAIGNINETNCLLLYHPPTKQIFTSDDYKLDETLASGPAFHLHYDGGYILTNTQKIMNKRDHHNSFRTRKFSSKTIIQYRQQSSQFLQMTPTYIQFCMKKQWKYINISSMK